MKKAVVISPTYNESKNVKKVIEAVFAATKDLKNWQVEMLIVDSSSPDNTAAIVKDLKKEYKSLHLLETPKEGLGKAYINGFKYAINDLKAFVVFEMDADLQHNPNDIPRFLEKIEKGADFVVGSRYIKGGGIPENWEFHRKLMSVFGNVVVRLGFMRLHITDWSDGYRAIKSWVIKDSLSHIQNYSGYVFQVALLDKAINLKARVEEIPVKFVDREEGISKMNSIQYIVQTLLYVFTHSSFIKFIIVGLTGFIVDFGISYVLIEQMKVAIWLATLISTESAIVSNFLLNNFWSFAHKRIDNSGLSYIFSFLKFNLVSSGSILIQTLGVQLLTHFFGHELWYIYKIGIIFFIVIPYSYIFYNKFVWKDK